MGDNFPPTEADLSLLIKCSKCQKIMESPRELDCGHIFCQKCLPTVNKSPTARRPQLLRLISVVCVECGKFTQVPGKDMEQLPAAPWIQLLHKCLYSNTNQKEVDLNQPCSGCKDPQSHRWCIDCEMMLCSQCGDKHTLMRKMKDHHVIDKSNASSKSKNILCSQHNDPIQWLCQDCPKLLCYQCIHQDCANHTFDKIADLAKIKKPKVNELILNVEAESQKLKDLGKALDQFQKEKNSQLAECEAKIISDIDKNIEQLQKAKTEMLECLNSSKTQMTNSIEELNNGITEKLSTLSNLLEIIQTVALPTHQMELVLSCPLLEKKVNNEQEQQYRLRDQISDFELQYTSSKIQMPSLKVKNVSLSRKASSCAKYPQCEMLDCPIYGHVILEEQAKMTKSDLMVAVPPPDRQHLDEVDTSSGSSSSPELLLDFAHLLNDNPNCQSIMDTEEPAKPEKVESISPVHITGPLPVNRKPLHSNSPKLPAAANHLDAPLPRPHSPCDPGKAQHYTEKWRPGYAMINLSNMDPPIQPCSKPLTWTSTQIKDGFDLLVLPNGNTLVTVENGIKMFDHKGQILKSQTVLGARGMTYRPKHMDILVAGYHSNTVYALHDKSLTFKADLKVTLKKHEKPWGCARLSDEGFVVLYSKDDKSIHLNFYNKDGEFSKTSNCGMTAKGNLHITTDCKDLIFISDENRDEIFICFPNENYIKSFFISKPGGMASLSSNRVIFVASGCALYQLELSQRDGQFSETKVVELDSSITSVSLHNNQFVCLTEDAVKVIPWQCDMK